MEAIETTVRADDGRVLESVPTADIVLVGVSRSSKTPVSMYLAQRGYKVANIPIVPDQAGYMARVESTLDAVPDARRIVALTIDPSTLRLIRQKRIQCLGVTATGAGGGAGGGGAGRSRGTCGESTYVSGVTAELKDARRQGV